MSGLVGNSRRHILSCRGSIRVLNVSNPNEVKLVSELYFNGRKAQSGLNQCCLFEKKNDKVKVIVNKVSRDMTKPTK